MTKQIAKLHVEMQPIGAELPATVAASIGRTVARHSYLEWSLAKSLYDLLGISIKQGRASVRFPPYLNYVPTVKTLLAHYGLSAGSALDRLHKLLLDAYAAREALAHSIYVRDPKTRKIRFQRVHGNFELGPQLEPVGRPPIAEERTVNRAFLAAQERKVETAIHEADRFRAAMNHQLKVLNDRRRTQHSMDRRAR